MPSLPLELADAVALFDLMRKHAPAPLILDMMHDRRAIVVQVFDGKVRIYERRLVATS